MQGLEALPCSFLPVLSGNSIRRCMDNDTLHNDSLCDAENNVRGVVMNRLIFISVIMATNAAFALMVYALIVAIQN